MKKAQIIILFFLIIAGSEYAFSQSEIKYDAKTGFGLYQGYYIGLDYYYKPNLSAGIRLGTYKLALTTYDNHFNILLENNFYFGKSKKYDHIRLFFFNQQVMIWQLTEPYLVETAISICFNIGMKLPQNENIGYTFGLGPGHDFNLRFNKLIFSDAQPRSNFLYPNAWFGVYYSF